MIDLKALRQLVKLMVDNDLSEVDLTDGEEKVKLKRGANGQPVLTTAAAPPIAPAPATAAPSPAAASGTEPADDDEQTGETIDSPMVGTFYTASSPDAPAFIGVGDSVSPETPVCIIEAMKVFNEIKAETSGKVKKLLVENGQAVEFGQPLFELE